MPEENKRKSMKGKAGRSFDCPVFATVYSIFYILDLRQKYPHGYNKNGGIETM